MPTLSMFFGIIIRMYKEVGGRHNIPHIHAEYGDAEAVYDFDGNLIEGSFPKKKRTPCAGVDRYSCRRIGGKLKAAFRGRTVL